jgi:hypothetical protein
VTGTWGTVFGPLAGGSAPLITELGLSGSSFAFGGIAITPILPYVAVGGFAVWFAAKVAC